MLLKTMGKGQGHLKAGFLGFSGSGKTWTSILLGAGVRNHFGLDGPMAMFDTEGGSEYVNRLARDRTGKDLIGIRSRALSDLMAAVDECLSGKVSVLIIDSISHVWTEACESYLAQINKNREWKRQRLEFQDWAAIKRTWQPWTNLYLNAPLHMIICGRAGYEWDFVPRGDDEKGRDLIKVGTKMKVESDFGFEPSLLCEMERIQVREGVGIGSRLTKQFIRRATVLKDRFGLIDGESCDNPEYAFFEAHVKALTAGAHAPVDTAMKTDHDVDSEGDSEFVRERREREILSQEIEGELKTAFPGQSTKDKQARLELMMKHFSTRAWTKIEKETPAMRLRAGLSALRTELESRTAITERKDDGKDETESGVSDSGTG